MDRQASQVLRLQLVREIAQGGMGTVFEALQHGADGFQKRVAVKSLRPELSNDETFVRMFVDEAKLVADLVHENIVQTYQLERDGEGYFMVMEYVHGVSLRDLLRSHADGERLPVALAVFIASRIARGLAYAHSRVDGEGRAKHIVHRDVSPSNVLITGEGLPKLSDFGIARAQARGGPAEGAIVGKFAYMSPEQALHFDLDGRADLYSLGTVLFEMLTGSRARSARDPVELLRMARRGEIDWERWNACGHPAPLEAIVRRSLEPKDDDRYASAADLARELELFIYKDGYGPTTATLEAYLVDRFPALARPQADARPGGR